MNRKTPTSLLVAAAALAVLLAGPACGPKTSSGEPAAPATAVSAPVSPDAAKTQSAADGTVLVTDNLDIDFSKHLITFIELGADKCIPCKAMQPIMKEIAAAFPDRVQVVFYDVWKDSAPAEKYGIQLIPTQVFLDQKGKEIARHVGLFPKEEILELLKKHGVQ